MAAPQKTDDLSASGVYKQWSGFFTAGQQVLQSSKTFFSHRYEYIKTNDNHILSVFLAAIAIFLLYMGGIWGVITFTASAVITNMASEAIKGHIEKIRFIWDDTQTGKVAISTAGFIFLHLYSWQIASAAFGIYISSMTAKNVSPQAPDATKPKEGSPPETKASCTIL